MKTTHEFHNHLLKRREVLVELNHQGAPSMTTAAKLIADHFKAGEDSVAIKHITNKIGTDKFMIDAFVYDSADQKLKIEQKPKQKKVVAN